MNPARHSPPHTQPSPRPAAASIGKDARPPLSPGVFAPLREHFDVAASTPPHLGNFPLGLSTRPRWGHAPRVPTTIAPANRTRSLSVFHPAPTEPALQDGRGPEPAPRPLRQTTRQERLRP
jgi:hypothetical protein